MRKIALKIVDNKNNSLPALSVKTLIKGYAEIDGDGKMSDETVREIQEACGDFLDYQRTMLDMVKRATDPREGIGYDENEQIRGLVKKLKDAGPGGSLLLEEAEFKFLCEKVKAPYRTVYSEVFDSFIQSVLDAESVTVSAVEEKAG